MPFPTHTKPIPAKLAHNQGSLISKNACNGKANNNIAEIDLKTQLHTSMILIVFHCGVTEIVQNVSETNECVKYSPDRKKTKFNAPPVAFP